MTEQNRVGVRITGGSNEVDPFVVVKEAIDVVGNRQSELAQRIILAMAERGVTLEQVLNVDGELGSYAAKYLVYAATDGRVTDAEFNRYLELRETEEAERQRKLAEHESRQRHLAEQAARWKAMPIHKRMTSKAWGGTVSAVKSFLRVGESKQSEKGRRPYRVKRRK